MDAYNKEDEFLKFRFVPLNFNDIGFQTNHAISRGILLKLCKTTNNPNKHAFDE